MTLKSFFILLVFIAFVFPAFIALMGFIATVALFLVRFALVIIGITLFVKFIGFLCNAFARN